MQFNYFTTRKNIFRIKLFTKCFVFIFLGISIGNYLLLNYFIVLYSQRLYYFRIFGFIVLGYIKTF